ncbi:DUF739 family protein [Listeria booriae]|uniref:DUF739 family protein n=1 Tax=Listeria booriae TaxID=1552123 RepID=UPI00164CF067|nr:DUF739 family protein [Listeria booriae]MBC6133892.1 DUF739 family protein [Listeria booriae]
MNTQKLKSVIALNGDTQSKLAKEVGLSEQRLSCKINEKNGAEFTQSEIATIKRLYSLKAEDVDSIFFNHFVS